MDRYLGGMTPVSTMILSGAASALLASGSLYSGAVFKRAFDQHHQAKTKAATPPLVTKSSGQDSAHHSKPGEKAVSVGSVNSEGQKGGVTAGYVETVNQAPPR